MRIDFERLEVVRDPLAVKPGDRVVVRSAKRGGLIVSDLLVRVTGPRCLGGYVCTVASSPAWMDVAVWADITDERWARLYVGTGKPGCMHVGLFRAGRVRVLRRSVGDLTIRHKELAR